MGNAQETGNNNAASLYGWRLYGDYGIVTAATPAGPADRYPTFYVAKLLQHFARGGDRRVEARSDSSLLAVHAARRMDGSLTLLAINKTPATTLDATIALRGYSPVGTAMWFMNGAAVAGQSLLPSVAASWTPQ